MKCEKCPAEFKTQRGLENHKCRWICKKCMAKYKTEAGYNRHVKNNCSVDKNKLAAIKVTDDMVRRRQEFEDNLLILKEKGLLHSKYAVGDTVFASGYYVTKPTHEQRFGRMVRVRYEEERRYYAEKRAVTHVMDPTVLDLYKMKQCVEKNEPFEVKFLIGYNFTCTGLHNSLEEATEYSLKESKSYKESCEFASMCR